MSYGCMKRNSLDFIVKSHQNIDCLLFNLAVNKAAKIKCKNGSMKYRIFWHKYSIVNNGKRKRSDLVPITKAPTPTEMSKGQSENTNNATKKFDYTAIADRLRTVSWSNYRHPIGVDNLGYGPNLPNPCNSRVIKRSKIEIPRDVRNSKGP